MPVLVGYRFWLQEQWTKTIALFAFAASVFRFASRNLNARAHESGCVSCSLIKARRSRRIGVS
jgi:hypothetical protein